MTEYIRGYRIHTPADEYISYLNRIGECPSWLYWEILASNDYDRYWLWREGKYAPQSDPIISHNLRILGGL